MASHGIFHHPQNVELGEAALDFWYNLLSHHLCTPEQAWLEVHGNQDEVLHVRAAFGTHSMRV